MSESASNKVPPVGKKQKKKVDQKGDCSNKPPQESGSGTVANKPSKATTKAERRAKQEAQRAAKEAMKASKTNVPPKEVPRVPDNVMVDVEKVNKRVTKNLEKQQVPQRASTLKAVPLFKHLHQYENDKNLTQKILFSNTCSIHPSFVQLGLQYANGVIVGSNARCVALMAAMKKVISDYTTPVHKEMSRDLDSRIKPYISFLKQCRPMSVSMAHAIKYLKRHISLIPPNTEDQQAKSNLLQSIDLYVKDNIILAGKRISELAREKIVDNDVIMVYACSSLICRILCDAHKQGLKFKVVVIDSHPRLEGREMLKRLLRVGIMCSYVLINAASFIIQQERVTKLYLGAHTLLANGSIMSRVGSSQLALLARSLNVPVLVCCETYKFCERMQTDSVVFNELGDPDDILVPNKLSTLSDWRNIESLRLLNLMYDVTPSDLVTLVITELGTMPCSSAPVVLRVKHGEL